MNVFKEISFYIIYCCEEMKKDLIKSEKKIPNDENTIRNYLLENYLDNNSFRLQNRMEMFHFMPEAPENYDNDSISYKGRVDIKIVNQNEWFQNGKAAYHVECKRLDGYSNLNKEYVINGIRRFVVNPTHYKSYYNKNFMLGFMVRNIDVPLNIKKIEQIQQKDTQIENLSDFIKNTESSKHIYDCEYRVDNRTIVLKHIFTDVSEGIIKK